MDEIIRLRTLGLLEQTEMSEEDIREQQDLLKQFGHRYAKVTEEVRRLGVNRVAQEDNKDTDETPKEEEKEQLPDEVKEPKNGEHVKLESI